MSPSLRRFIDQYYARFLGMHGFVLDRASETDRKYGGLRALYVSRDYRIHFDWDRVAVLVSISAIHEPDRSFNLAYVISYLKDKESISEDAQWLADRIEEHSTEIRDLFSVSHAMERHRLEIWCRERVAQSVRSISAQRCSRVGRRWWKFWQD